MYNRSHYIGVILRLMCILILKKNGESAKSQIGKFFFLRESIMQYLYRIEIQCKETMTWDNIEDMN